MVLPAMSFAHDLLEEADQFQIGAAHLDRGHQPCDRIICARISPTP
jgi:hypothetical protein